MFKVTEVKQIENPGLQREIPWINDEMSKLPLAVLNTEEVKAAYYVLKEKKLLAQEKEKKDFERKLVARMKGWL